MYNHAPSGYVCPFCLIAKGIENENINTKQNDIIFQDNYVLHLYHPAGGKIIRVTLL